MPEGERPFWHRPCRYYHNGDHFYKQLLEYLGQNPQRGHGRTTEMENKGHRGQQEKRISETAYGSWRRVKRNSLGPGPSETQDHFFNPLQLTQNFLFTETKSIWKVSALLLQNGLPPVKNKKKLRRVHLADSPVLYPKATPLLAMTPSEQKWLLWRGFFLQHLWQNMSVRAIRAELSQPAKLEQNATDVLLILQLSGWPTEMQAGSFKPLASPSRKWLLPGKLWTS